MAIARLLQSHEQFFQLLRGDEAGAAGAGDHDHRSVRAVVQHSEGDEMGWRERISIDPRIQEQSS